uniref:Ras GTPase-activating protein-binding protein 2-like n=1 Tax=Diabrotica virgifera virgifera TaxID=50390 RepID=A0A6P7HH15_DIAVI
IINNIISHLLLDERRRSQSQNFNDVNQLFLGNLPHNATEDELRNIFSDYGNIIDLRVHSKPPKSGGPPGARAPPNYGFITYETQQAVENCLRAKVS